jgi:hypothetical protein
MPSGMLRRVVSQKLTDVSEVFAAIINTRHVIQVVIVSETSVNFYNTTLRSIPEVSHLHTRRRENLKSHSSFLYNFTIVSEKIMFICCITFRIACSAVSCGQ